MESRARFRFRPILSRERQVQARTPRRGSLDHFDLACRPRTKLEFFGDDAAAELYRIAIENVEKIGGERVEIDFSVFRAAADLLYSGPWVAERFAAIRPFIESHADEMNSVVHGIISGATRYSAVDAFESQYRLADLRSAAEREWERMDVLVLADLQGRSTRTTRSPRIPCA
jgi:allophanate hydrolase